MTTNKLGGVLLSLALCGPALPLAAQEQPSDFPRRPISLVVVYPAGGAVDVTARTFAEVASNQLDAEFRVENRVGGAGMVGHTYLARQAQADGYTIGVLANPFMFTDVLLRDADFGIEAFDPIATISFDPIIWVTRSESEIGQMSFDEIMTYAEDNTLQVGMNPNSIFLFVSEFIEESEDVSFNYIPFDGGRQGVTALLSGEVDATASFYTEVEQFIENGDLTAVAVTGEERHPQLPDVPTLPELGVPAGGEAWGATRIFTLPEGVPEDRREWLAGAFYDVLTSDELATAFDEAGLTLTPQSQDEAQESYQSNFDTLESFLSDTGRLTN